MLKYAIVIEKAKGNYSAYVPDLPGCVSVGDTLEEIKENIQEACCFAVPEGNAFHLEGMQEDGLPIPEPSTECDYVEVMLV